MCEKCETWIERHITIRTLLEDAKMWEESGFFRRPYISNALLSFYSADNWKVDKAVYDLLYRLAEMVPAEERSGIHIYPSSEGHIFLGEGEEQVQWDSLQDWMDEWRAYNSPIQALVELLPPGMNIQLLTAGSEAT